MLRSMDATLLGNRLREVARLHFQAQRAAIAECGAGSMECQALLELGRRGRCSQSELTGALGTDKAWVSRCVRALATQGLVRRMQDPVDRRVATLALTRAGRARARDLNRRLNALSANLVRTLAREDRAAAGRILSSLHAGLREHVRKGGAG